MMVLKCKGDQDTYIENTNKYIKMKKKDTVTIRKNNIMWIIGVKRDNDISSVYISFMWFVDGTANDVYLGPYPNKDKIAIIRYDKTVKMGDGVGVEWTDVTNVMASDTLESICVFRTNEFGRVVGSPAISIKEIKAELRDKKVKFSIRRDENMCNHCFNRRKEIVVTNPFTHRSHTLCLSCCHSTGLNRFITGNDEKIVMAL